LISASEVEAVFGMRQAVECVEEAFVLYGRGEVQMPPKVYLTFEKGDLRCMPVYMPTLGIAGVKNVNVHPRNSGIPTVMATITLIDPEDGYPLAVMDGTYITNLRTGAAGAVAAKYLARKESKVAGFIGAGAQAETQLAGLKAVMPGLETVLAYDVRVEQLHGFCRMCAERLGLEARAAASAEEVAQASDILTTTTPVRHPVVRDEWVRPGTHINAIGADAAGKQELESAILKRSRVFIDNWEQASHSGEINVPVSLGELAREDIAGDIGELVTDKKPGRESAEQVTVFDSTGLALQDISCAFAVYKGLSETEGGAMQRFRFF